MEILTPIPEHLLTSFLKLTLADLYPVIYRLYTIAYFPAFIRKLERSDLTTGQTKTVYRYFTVKVPYTGQQLEDYMQFIYLNYAAIRKHFYGTFLQQEDLRYHYKLQAHILAIKQAFPKAEGLIPEGITRFNTVKELFWSAIDSALLSVGKTRADLPQQPFNALTMLTWARENGMSQEAISTYATTFSAISLNLVHNNRNWVELF